MVNVKRYQKPEGGPPPQDESWWEAVLTEEEELGDTLHKNLAKRKQTSPPKNRSQAFNGEVMDWQRANELYEQDQAIEVEVTGFNRGGLLVNAPHLQGFVPVSHLIEAPDEDADVEGWLATYVERCISVKVIECDRERGRVVFSERAALATSGSRNRLLHDLKPGDTISGSVTNITDFGVFVDLGGVEGLIHVSEISWGRVRHPSDVVSLGSYVDVYVIQIDQERARVALSIKRMHPNPWETAEDRYFPGQIVEAVVTSLVPFGAFARMEEGLDGLVHISEMSPDGKATHPEDCLHEGQRIRARVLHVDGTRQRLGLSLRLSDTE